MQCAPNRPRVFSLGEHFYASILGDCPIFQKNWWWANQSDSFREKTKKKVCPPSPHRPPTPSPIIGSTFLGLIINKLFLEVSILFLNYSFEILKVKDYYLWMSKFWELVQFSIVPKSCIVLHGFFPPSQWLGFEGHFQ
jgi:hypothetical protein